MANEALTKYLYNRQLQAAEYRRKRAESFAQRQYQQEYDAQKQTYEAEQARIQKEQEEIDNATFWETLGNTLADFGGARLLGGFAKGIEGLIDAGAGIVGGIGGLWDKDFQNRTKEFISNDWTGENITNPILENTKASLLQTTKVGGFIGDVGSAVGQMLPAVALQLVPGVGQALSGSYLFGSAMGGGTEQAFNDGADYYKGLGYGAVQGGMELLMETVSDKVFGAGLRRIARPDLVTGSLGKQVLKQMGSEAFEEGTQALLEPAAKSIYKGKEALQEYKDPNFLKDVAYQAAVGGATGGLMAGGSYAVQGVSSRKMGGLKAVNIGESLQELNTLDTKENNLWKNDKYTPDKITAIEQNRQAEMNNISSQLKSMDNEQRAEAIKKFSLDKQFTVEGDIIVSDAKQAEVDTNATAPITPIASHNKAAYSPNLRNTELQFAPTSGELTQFQTEAKKTITSLVPNAKIVATDNNGDKAHAFVDNKTGIFYINKNATSTDIARAVAVHEITHTLEGTKQYDKLASFVEDNLPDFEDRIAQKIEQYKNVNTELKQGANAREITLYEARTEVVAKYLGDLLGNEESIKRIVNQNKSVALRIYEWLKSAVSKLFGKGDTFLRQAEKLFADAIKHSVGGVGLSDIDKALTLYKQMAETEDADIEGTKGRNEAAMRFSLKKDSSGRMYVEISDDVLDGIPQTEWKKIINDNLKSRVVYVANSAIQINTKTRREVANSQYTSYVKNNEPQSYGDKVRTISYIDEVLQASTDYVNEGLNHTRNDNIIAFARGKTLLKILENDYSAEVVVGITKGNNLVLYDIINFKKDNIIPRFSLTNKNAATETPSQETRREVTETVSTNSIRNNSENVNPKNENNRYSLPTTDSEGNTLTPEQQEFFKDSKVRDEQGRLLKVYHGTKNEFNTFDKMKARSAFYGKGFYFTTNKKFADSYGRTIKAHLNIKNPFVIDYNDFINIELNKRYGLDKQEINNILSNLGLESFLEEKGFDGVKVTNARSGIEFVAFSPSQIKLTTNKNPTTNEDIRYSLKEDYKYSKGQVAKYVAEHSKEVAYNRTDAERIISHILENIGIDNKTINIDGKTRSQVVDILWAALNSKPEGYRLKTGEDIADIIIKNAVMEDIFADKDFSADKYIIRVLRDYLHSVDLSGIKDEIKAKYDTNNNVFNLWNKRQGTKGFTADQIAKDIGISFEGRTEADIFFEIDEMYRHSVSNLKKEAKKRLSAEYSGEDLKLLKGAIAREILLGYDKTGHKTTFAKTVEKYTSQISNLKSLLKDEKVRSKAVNNLLSTVQRAKNYKGYVSAGMKLPEQVERFVAEIAKIETWRGNISKLSRETLGKITELYREVFGAEATEGNYYIDYAAQLALGSKELTTEEIKNVDKILQNFIHEAKNYDKVIIQEKAVSETECAEKGLKEARLTQKIRTKHKGITGGMRNFFEQIYNPYRLMQSTFGYIPNSIGETFYNDLLDGNRRRAKFVAQSVEVLGKYTKSETFQKSMLKNVTFDNITMTRGEMLSLYLTMKREQGLTHILNTKEVRLLDQKLVEKGKMKEAQTYGKDINVDETMLKSIEENLTTDEKEFIKAIREFLDKVAKQAKTDTDMLLRGVTNALQDNYFPLRSADDQLYTDAEIGKDFLKNILKRYGFNIETAPNAKTKLVIENVFEVLARHINDMSIYYGYAVPITSYNRVMNKRIEGVNIQNEVDKINPNFKSYMNELLLNIQGISKQGNSWGSRAINRVRLGLALSSLNLNPKVLLSQTVSIASALSEINPKYVAKGMSGFFVKQAMADVVKYSPLMAERNELIGNIDVQEIRQGASKLGQIGQVITAPMKLIEKMDAKVIATIYQSLLNEQADLNGWAIDSEENKIAAARRTEEVVFRSQQTSDQLGRSAFMRNKNELVRMFSMFKGDAIQLASQFISSIDRVLTYKKMIKSGDAELVKIGQEGMKEAKTAFAKSGTAVFMNATWLTLIALAMKAIKGFKDDEEVGDVVVNEVVSNLMGMLPLGSEFYSLLSGYDLDNPVYSAMSTIANTAKDVWEGVGALVTDDKIDPVKTRSAARRTALGFAQMLGLPLRNIESYGIGIVGNISPETRAEYDALFKTKSNTAYMNSITKALEKGDYSAADRYINIMFNSRTGKIKDDKVLETMRDLIEAGYTNVLPKSLGDTIIYNNEEIELTNKQYTAFKKIYAQADEKVKVMVNSNLFGKLNDAAKAKAVKTIYDFYYNLGLEDLLGEDLENKNILFSKAIPIEQLAMAVAQAQQLEADLDNKGSIVSGSRKAKVQAFINSLNLTAAQKYIIMGYLGYVNRKGDKVVHSYINSLKLSKTQKETLYEMSGYELSKAA